MRRLILSAAITLACVLLASPAFAEKRVALVVGINAYASPNVPRLHKAVNDARALGGLLKRLGYEVIESYDPPRAEFNARKREFLARAAGAEVALLFYSGHGVELGAENYMLPANFPWDPDAPKAARQSLIADEGVALSKVLEELEVTDARRKVVILDACRENPLRDKTGGKTLGGERGLARPAVTPDGTYIVYSAGIGQTALDRFSDNDPDPNSVFMRRLLPELQVAGRSFDAAVKAARLKVREDARRRLNHVQHPAIYDQMFGDFHLAGALAPPPPEEVRGPRAVDDRWVNVEADGRATLELTTPPKLKPPSQAIISVVGIFPQVKSVFKDCADCPELVVLPAGSFTMGSPVSEPGRESREGPQHRVTISRDFAVGRYELTFDEWDACVMDGGCRGYRPTTNGWGRGRRPVIHTNWRDAQSYCQWLTNKTGRIYRLPTEAEWEYAARADSSTAYAVGSSISTDQANYYDAKRGNSGKTTPAGSFMENAFGLFDMHGNVWEWVEDCYVGDYRRVVGGVRAFSSKQYCNRVIRGGSWATGPSFIRSASRGKSDPSARLPSIGFRLIREIDN